ncbi:MAG: phosphatidylserine decarboxylase family protein [Bacteroidetes bacterium]|nr:MAG: phosphatidylserine decarboxylase family protein [Bacteroidota bacterium]
MHYHKEGYKIILISALLVILLDTALFIFLSNYPVLKLVLVIGLIVLLIIIIQFFRVPHRKVVQNDELIFSGADGKVVVIEEVFESEYFKDKRIQVSVFMSPLNVHVNYYSLKGLITYFKYHAGRYLVAWHPKSSTENERTTIVIKHPNGFEILMRQIAGAMARRIVCYANLNEEVDQAGDLGFIKFGSRVDLFLPLGSEILVKMNQKVKGQITPIAKIKVQD